MLLSTKKKKTTATTCTDETKCLSFDRHLDLVKGRWNEYSTKMKSKDDDYIDDEDKKNNKSTKGNWIVTTTPKKPVPKSKEADINEEGLGEALATTTTTAEEENDMRLVNVGWKQLQTYLNPSSSEAKDFPLSIITADILHNKQKLLEGKKKNEESAAAVATTGASADDILIQTLINIRMQLSAGLEVFGNCCMHSHAMYFDLIKEGCGRTPIANSILTQRAKENNKPPPNRMTIMLSGDMTSTVPTTCLQETTDYYVCCPHTKGATCKEEIAQLQQ